MPINITNVNVTPIAPQPIRLDMKKIIKHAQSRQGVEGARRFEEKLKCIDYWHPQYAKEIRDDADKSLYGYINAVFGEKLSVYERDALFAQIRTPVIEKINSMIQAMDGVELFNVGVAGDEVIKCAIERDNHLTVIDGILNEAKRNGQTKLTPEQARSVKIEFKKAYAYDEKRRENAQTRIEANNKNREIATSLGPDVYKAYCYLYE